MGFETLLNGEIQNELENLKKMELGTENYRATVDGLAKLMDRSIELRKFQAECKNNREIQVMENDIKLAQMADEKKDRLVKNAIAIAGIVLPMALTIWGAKKSWKFEEEGTITSTMGRGFMSRILPKK